MKKLGLVIVLICVLISFSHAKLSPFGFAKTQLSHPKTSRPNTSMDGGRVSEPPGPKLPANMINSGPNHSEESSEYDVLRHQNSAMNILLGWSGVSIITGSVMLFNDSRIMRDFGVQNVAWGAIDGGIALYARRSISDKWSSSISVQEEKRSFRRLLLANSLLDVAYIGVGTALAASGRDGLKGHGYGIIVQGAFLLLFDGINLLLIPER